MEQVKVYPFVWSGVNNRGIQVDGEINSPNEIAAKYKLKNQGIDVTDIKKKKSPLFSFGSSSKVRPADIVLFTRQLATMMKAGVPLVQGLDIVIEGITKPALRKVVTDIRQEVFSGSPLSQALNLYPDHFDKLYRSLIKSGEESGNLELMLSRIAHHGEKEEALKKKIKKAMVYPASIVAVAIVVTGILLIKVVPSFAETFDSFGAELPAFTLMILNLSDWVTSFWWWILFMGYGIFKGFQYLKKTSPAFSDRLDKITLKLPIVGKVVHDAIIARFTRTLSTTYGSGVPITDSMESAAGAAGNVVFRKAILDIKEDVTSGVSMNMSLRSSKKFPIMLVQMTAIGEESGTLDEMLGKVADHYEMEVDNAVDSLSSLMEPMIMSVLGVLVGGLMIAMYLPIFQLGSVM
jgi:type IV pilus assembly protein PilC